MYSVASNKPNITYYLEVLNLDNFSISVKSDFDSGWMFLSPSEFKIPPGEAKRILAVFFIPEAEDPQRDGEILFRSEDENKQAPVKVAISAPMAKGEKDYEAWIEVEYKDSYLKIRAFCLNNTSEDEVLRYELEARKSGKRGTAKTFQAGSVLIPTQEKKSLSQSTLSVSPKDNYWIKLQVYKDGKLVAEDSIFYPQILEACSPPGIASLPRWWNQGGTELKEIYFVVFCVKVRH